MKKRLLALLMLAVGGISGVQAADDFAGGLSSGQTLYLPVYSHIWHGDRVVDNKYPLKHLVSALISIRNTSLKTPIRVVSARYYSTDGKLLKEYLPKPAAVGAMGTLELFVEREESEGGSGANFVIQWDAAAATNPPVVEAVHANIKGPQSLAFVTTARVIQADK
ncbi:MAG TPA: DUF3124 domain-containing protein [Gallionella sp.]|nr:DUF3124 domain-containing protein [Gallionella sp.]